MNWEKVQKCNFTKKIFELFDFMSFFAWTFLNCLAYCAKFETINHWHWKNTESHIIIIILWPLINSAAHHYYIMATHKDCSSSMHYCTMATHKVCRLLLSHGHSHRLQLIIIILRPVINSAAHHYYLMAIPKVCSSSLLFYGHS